MTMSRDEFFSWMAEYKTKALAARELVKAEMIHRLETEAAGTVWIDDDED